MRKRWKLCGRSESYVEGGGSYVVGGGSYVEEVVPMWKSWKLYMWKDWEAMW